jgi:D-alanyl-D-alanine dipeptidase
MISPVSRKLRHILFLGFLSCIPFLILSVHSEGQTADQAPSSVLPGPKPPDHSSYWESLVGIYGKDHPVLILERDQQLIYRDSGGVERKLIRINSVMFATDPEVPPVTKISLPAFATLGPVPFLSIHGRRRVRTDATGSSVYRVKPERPLNELRAEALLASPPVEAGPFRKADLVEIATLDPAFRLDIRYARYDNFLSTPVYTQARAFMQRPAAEALLRVLRKLQPLGYGLLIHDAYRPWYVTKIFWDATPPAGKIFVADPQKGSKHNRGCAVDLTLYDLATGQAVEMPGLYDEMSPRSFPTFPGGTSLQRWHRDLLRRAMESEGFTVNKDEWWHFDYKDWKQYGILNVAFEKIADSLQPTAISH